MARSPFVGREREIAALAAALDDARAGSGRLVLVSGEPGIGKTRLAEELAELAEAKGTLVLWGRCHEAGGAAAYWPWVQVIRAYAAGRETRALRSELGAGAADVAQIVPELRDRLGVAAAAPTSDADVARFRLFDAVSELLRRAAERRPLVIVLDDVHAADGPSLLLLEFVARDARRSRCLVVATYRDVALTARHPLARTVGTLARIDGVEHVALRGLGESDVARLIEEVAPVRPAAELIRAVHGSTEGNPFFVTQVVRLLASAGELERADQARAWTIAIPQGVRDAIGQRLAALSDECARLLAVASLLGREFHLAVLSRAAGIEGDRLLAALDEAIGARIVQEVPGHIGTYAFSHALIAETLRDGLTTVQRALLHRRIGEALEELPSPAADERVEELAHHFFEAARAGEAEKAIAHAMRAALRASERLAFEEAAAHYGRALQALELAGGDVRREAELLLLRAESLRRAGDATARDAFLRAATVARDAGDGERLARAALGYAGGWEWWRYEPRVVDLLEAALRALPEHEDLSRARVLARLGLALRRSPTSERALAVIGEAEGIARRVGDGATLAAVLEAKQVVTFDPSAAPGSDLALTDEIARLAENAGDREAVALHRLTRSLHLLRAGDAAAAERELDACAALIEDLRQPVLRWRLGGSRWTFAFLAGDMKRCEALARDTYEIGRRVRPDAAQTIFVAHRMMLGRIVGAPDPLEDDLRAIQRYEDVLPRVSLLLIHLDAGRHDDARRELAALSAERFGTLPRDTDWLIAVTALAEACARLRDLERAAELYDILLPCAGRVAVNGAYSVAFCAGSVTRSLGMLAALLGKPEFASQFADALALDARLGPLPAAWTELELGAAYVDRGEQRLAVPTLERALATARSLGLVRFARRAEELLARAGAAAVAGGSSLRCFGGFELTIDGRAIDPAHVKPRARSVLHLLALHAGRPVHREVLIEALWPEVDREAGARNLHTAVSALRSAIDPALSRAGRSVLVREGESYRLALAEGAMDLVRFERALTSARAARARGEAAAAISACRSALDEYAGDLLPESGPASWVVEERERLRGEAARAAEELAELLLAQGEAAAAAAAAERGLRIDRYRDALWTLLARAHAAAGNDAASARARREYERVLAEVAPGS